MYIQYLINPDEKVISFWLGILRPYLYKNYPLNKIGIYNQNADLHLFINQIEQIIKNNKEKELIINNKNSHSPTLSSTSTCDTYKSFNSNKKDDNNKKNNLVNDIDIIIENEEEFDEKEESNDKNEIKISNLIKSRVDLFNKRLLGMNINLPKSKSLSIYKEMKPNYIDKDEIESKTIEFNPNNKIKLIDVDLLLKKVAENSLSEENNKILYAFIKQSFSFLNIDIFLKKLIKCYEYHKSKDKLNPKVQNLIEFLNAFVIEMIVYDKSPISDDKILGIINSFYISLKNDVMNIIKYQKLTRIKNQEIKRRILNEQICTKEIDKNGETIKWWDTKLVKKKLKNHHKRTIFKYKELREKEKREKHNKKLETNDNKLKLENENEINEIQKAKFLPRLSLKYTSHQFDVLKKMPTMNINSFNNNLTLKQSNSKDNIFKAYEKKKPKERFNEDQLVQILGNKHEDLIKNKNLIITKEENFLLILKNITKLLKQKSYSEELILKTKFRENFYAKPFFENEKEIYKKRKELKKTEPNENRDLDELNIIKTSIISDKKNYFCVTDYKIEQIGEQLISVSKNTLYKIESKELYNAIFTKNEKYIKSQNIMDNIQKFNNLIFFIVEDILSYDTPKDRAKIIDQWVLIAKYCKSRKDQSNCLAINSALNHYIITGLDQTLINLKPSTKIIMKEIMDYCSLEGNYKIFREEIKNIKKDEFYLPYLGIILRDFIFFEEKGKYITQGNMVNFEKIENVQNSIDTFFEFKNRIDKVKVELNKELVFFENLGEKNEQNLEKLANDLEPEFKLGEAKEGIKRLTDIDIKYFGDFGEEE